MTKLDRTRPYGAFFVGSSKFYGQDGKVFDMATGEEVQLHIQESPSIPCKLCGANCVDLAALEMHVKKAHGIDLTPKPPKEDAPEPAEAVQAPELPKTARRMKSRRKDN